jgi:uncharacterized membrane protein YkvA (DUF1232 family)
MAWLTRIKSWAKHIKQDVVALWFAGRDARTPFLAKVTAAFVVAYALSPIDLIPDFIPLLGYLDDLVILPVGIWIVVRMIPKELMAEFRNTAAMQSRRPSSKTGLAMVLGLWALFAGLFAYWYFLL